MPSVDPAKIDRTAIVLFAILAFLFTVRNLPWQLDDYDQAKQAQTVVDIIENGAWIVQHNPRGGTASKPPLMSWISATLYYIVPNYDFVWRFPSLVASIIMLWLIWKDGVSIGGRLVGLVSMIAFGFNQLSLRIATLVRTDMLLCLFLYLMGRMILQHLQSQTPWSFRDKLWFGFWFLLSLYVKGPLAVVFLAPAIAVYAIFVDRKWFYSLTWTGWLSWIVPPVLFAIWMVTGILLDPDIYDHVFISEYLQRLNASDSAVHHVNPTWFYLVEMLTKFIPWTWSFLFLMTLKSSWKAVRGRKDLLWLLCWFGIGFIVSSIIPSKRLDRIYPLIPPMCLLIGALSVNWVKVAPDNMSFRSRRRIIVWTCRLAIFYFIAYTGVNIALDKSKGVDRLSNFCAQIRQTIQYQQHRIALHQEMTEGMIVDLRAFQLHTLENLADAWSTRQIDAFVIKRELYDTQQKLFPDSVITLQSQANPGQIGYDYSFVTRHP